MTQDLERASAPTGDITNDDKIPYRHGLDAALAALTPNTRRAYTQALRLFRTFCDEQGWTDSTLDLLRRPVLQAWEADMRGRALSAQTIGLRLAAVRWAATLAADADQLDEAELARMQRVKVHGSGVRQGVWLDAGSLLRLVRSPRGTDPRAVRDRAMLALAAGCGLRRAELCGLMIGHVDERNGDPVALVNLLGKGVKLRSVAIPAWARPYLASWLQVYRQHCNVDSGSPLVCEVTGGGHGTPTGRAIKPGTFYRVLAQASTLAGLPPVSPHDLRRTAARLMLDGGAGLDAIRDALGHSSLATTERYLATTRGPATGTLAMDRLMTP